MIATILMLQTGLPEGYVQACQRFPDPRRIEFVADTKLGQELADSGTLALVPIVRLSRLPGWPRPEALLRVLGAHPRPDGTLRLPGGEVELFVDGARITQPMQ